MKIQKDQRGITHVLMLAGIAVLVLGAVGFAGFKVYKSKNDVKAKAATHWVNISACRVNSSSTWGFTIKNPTSKYVGIKGWDGASFSTSLGPYKSTYLNGTVTKSVVTIRYWQTINGTNPGGWTTKTIYASRISGC